MHRTVKLRTEYASVFVYGISVNVAFCGLGLDLWIARNIYIEETYEHPSILFIFNLWLTFDSSYIVNSPREESSLQDIQPDEFHVKMQDPDFLEEAQLIDVREPDEVYALVFHFDSPA
ncbi:hypothetical protein Patl1_29357 [Pistacia atlantica]|uniref:Uncharacterized protein n=1 Tax=Pistacia atlantica TaxID=434234 RepID=A0ACC1AEE6_9ROSI|nr:hypothetical protein Patl1_29357 [Pistacia atlantica]